MFTLCRVRAGVAACVAAAVLSLPPAPAPAQVAREHGRPAPRALTVTVTDKKGGLVTGLGRASFTVLDGGVPSEIVSFASGDMPSTVGVLLDASGSFSVARLGFVRAAVLRFFKGCNPSDEFFLMAFNQSPQLIQGLTDDPAAVLGALDRYAAVEPRGRTALYDALYLALNEAARGRHPKRALLLVTDGQDNQSHYKFEELRRQLRESDVTVYAVGIVGPNDELLGYGGRAVLDELTSVSGGRAFFASTEKELNTAMEAVAEELRNQYVIGFAPAGVAARKDGWHDVRVRLGEVRDAGGRKVKTVLRARPGFYDVPPARRR